MIDNNELEEYIENNILIKYDENNIGGHGREHIESVIKRSLELNEKFNLNLNTNMIYVIAAYHDIGYKINAEKHEEVSSNMFLNDEDIKSFFTNDEVKTISEAIVDHRASLEYEPRSIYGKLVSSADREISVDNYLKRSILYQAHKHKNESPTINDIINFSYKKISSKYGKQGYAKMYFEDDKYKNYLKEIQEVIEDKEKFVSKELEIMENELNIDTKDINKAF